ncbi:MAG TPA: hypothetical protein V6D13_09560 [Halomicronema sp.]
MKLITNQSRRYKFCFLNPYKDVRFSYCPKCTAKTKLRKVPLVIEIEKSDSVILNKSCRYCPPCDLLIVHKDEIEQEINNSSPSQNNKIPLSNYTITGTLDRRDWLRQQRPSAPQLQQSLYSFKQILKFEPAQWIKLNVQWKLVD